MHYFYTTHTSIFLYKVSLLVVLSAFVGAPTSGRLFFVFTSYSSTIITTDSKGQKLVKKFSNNMLNMEAVLTDAAGKELARLTKVFSADGKDITSTVVYGK